MTTIKIIIFLINLIGNDKFMNVKAEEWYAVILSFIYYFFVLAAYYIIRPIRDQLAAEVGSGQLPLFFFATFVGALLLTPMFNWLVSHWPRRVIMPFVYLFFIGCQLIFIPFFYENNWLSPKNLGILFFVWVSLFNLFAVSVFWSFMSDIWNDVQARRLFPIIALGGVSGAVIGPLITHSLVKMIGLALLLAMSTLFLIGAVICVLLLGNWAEKHGLRRHDAGNAAALGGGMLDGLKQIFTNSFIGQMSLIMLLNDAIGTIAYVLVTDYSGATFPNDPIARTRFAADMDLYANIFQVMIQLTITRWLLIRHGASLVFALCATIIVFASLAMAFSDPFKLIQGMPIVACVLIISRALSYGMIQPARETLYTLVSRDLRYKGKNAVDTVVWRFGDIVSTLSINGLRSLGLTVTMFGVIWAVLAATSGWMAYRLANRVERNKHE